jgi:hypothetical protein
MIRKYGVKTAMFQQTAWAAARNLCQIYAQTIGGSTGIRIIEITQFFNILGGGGGAQLAGNAYIAALVSSEGRTGAFGVMSGVSMLGSSLGFVGKLFLPGNSITLFPIIVPYPLPVWPCGVAISFSVSPRAHEYQTTRVCRN